SWTGSTDNVGVTAYQVERCQGASCNSFALVASPPTTTFSDTGLAASISYSYRVRAQDAANNVSNYTNVATATTAASSGTPGLVAAYGFNENGGITTPDASGNGRNASLTGGPPWSTPGQDGTPSARAFNGTSPSPSAPT